MDYSILRYGAVADGVTNCAAAIQQAVDAAAAAGGGRVIVPAGRFLSGSVLLKDNVELHLESGAVLISSLSPADITPFLPRTALLLTASKYPLPEPPAPGVSVCGGSAGQRDARWARSAPYRRAAARRAA